MAEIEREAMDVDVVIVGAGPAGLSAAIRLKQIDADLNVVVLEKGSEVGAHILSGAVLDTSGIDALIPDWKDRGAPIKGWVRLDLAKVNLDKAKVTVFDGGTNLELRAESGAENVWEGELTGPAEHAAVMTKMGATCDATICRSVIDEPQPTLSLIGADQQARAEAAITAMQDYRTECME